MAVGPGFGPGMNAQLAGKVLICRSSGLHLEVAPKTLAAVQPEEANDLDLD